MQKDKNVNNQTSSVVKMEGKRSLIMIELICFSVSFFSFKLEVCVVEFSADRDSDVNNRQMKIAQLYS